MAFCCKSRQTQTPSQEAFAFIIPIIAFPSKYQSRRIAGKHQPGQFLSDSRRPLSGCSQRIISSTQSASQFSPPSLSLCISPVSLFADFPSKVAVYERTYAHDICRKIKPHNTRWIFLPSNTVSRKLRKVCERDEVN